MSNWSREQVTLLINEYKKYPSLYAVKTKSYVNKHARMIALDQIKSTVDTIKPGVSINDIKTKFNGLKATFLSEHRKHEDSLGTGKGEDEIYHPSLWYYEDFHFILDHVQPRPSMDSLSCTQEESETQIECDENEGDDEMEIPSQTYVINDDTGFLEAETSSTDVSRPSSSLYEHVTTGPKPKRKREREDCSLILKEASATLRNISATMKKENNTAVTKTTNVPALYHIDDNLALAQFVVSKLKQITVELVRLKVEQEITQILYDGIKRCKNT